MMGRWIDLIGPEWGRLREAGFTEQRTPPALDGKKNTPESHNSLSSDTLINTWELMNGHEEDWIHLHSKPKLLCGNIWLKNRFSLA
ncbi:hypothetical protein YC2023_048283 [Brassica napus]